MANDMSSRAVKVGLPNLVSWWIPPGGGAVRSAAAAPWDGCGARELEPTPATEVGPLCRSARAPVPKEYGPWEGVAG